MYTILLLIMAILPPLFFLMYLLKADRTEPEPLQMVLYTLALGIVSTLPASLFEALLGLCPLFGEETFTQAALSSFIQIAPVEEACKLGVVLLFVWNNKNFNEENDGIVYVTASAIGFALFENVLYVLEGGIGTGVGRAFTSIPLHTFCGVLMGSYVGRARFAGDKKTARSLILKGFALAWAIHGLYDTLAMSHTESSGGLLIILVAALFVVGKRVLKLGHSLSEARWANPFAAAQIRIDTSEQHIQRAIAKYGEEKIGIDESGTYFLKPEKQTWKLVTAIILFALAVLCWVCLIGYIGGGEEIPEILLPTVVYLSIMMTCVPLILGVLLSMSYRRRLTKNHYF